MWKEIIEGNTRLLVPVELLEGTIRRRSVFYNPMSKLSRDVSCAVLRALAKERKLNYLDLLAGTGARGIRIANEAGCTVHLNDGSKQAIEVIKKNAELNGVSVTISNMDGNRLMMEKSGVFDFIDIDPYGSPAPYLEGAADAIKPDAFMAFAATDTAALHGLYPGTCLKRYSARSLRCEFSREIGLRILLGHAARTLAAHSRGMHCLLSHSTMHYHRAYLRVIAGKQAADSTLKEMGYVYYCRNCLDRRVEHTASPGARRCDCGGEYEIAGPLWQGSIVDKEFCDAVLEDSRYLADADLEKLLSTLSSELEVPFYYDIHHLCKKMRISCPTRGKVMDELKNSGFDASRTHFSPTAIKTSVTVKEVKRALLPIFLFMAVFAELLHGVAAVIAKDGAALPAFVDLGRLLAAYLALSHFGPPDFWLSISCSLI